MTERHPSPATTFAALLFLGAISGCYQSHGRDLRLDAGAMRDGGRLDAGRADAARRDGGRSDAGRVDAARPDAGDCAGEATFFERGYCFVARRCCAATDCGDPARWTCTANGRCEDQLRPCFCVADGDCGAVGTCVVNEVVCGACLPVRPACTGPTDCAGAPCRDGWCQADGACMRATEP